MKFLQFLLSIDIRKKMKSERCTLVWKANICVMIDQRNEAAVGQSDMVKHLEWGLEPLPLNNSVTLDKSFYLSEPQFPYL